MTTERKGHYLAGPTRPTVPGVIFAVDVHAGLVGTPTSPNVTTREWMSASACVMYRKRTGWTHPQDVRVSTPESLRQWMSDRSLAGRVNWVVCPIASEVLTLSKWWDHAEAQGVVWRSSRGDSEGTGTDHREGSGVVFDRLVVRCHCDIVRYSEEGRRWCWCSARNWGDVLARTGEGSDPLERDVPGRVDGRGATGGKGSDGEVVRLARGLARLCDWWREHARRPFGVTAAALGWGMLQTHTPPRVLCTHKCPDSHRLERSASFGGRASVFFVGSIGDGCGVRPSLANGLEPRTAPGTPGPITQVDVRSMYPYLMSEGAFPSKLCGYAEGMSVRELLQLSEGFGVVARVTVRTTCGEYPYRSGDRVVYPIGSFTTTLTGPELLKLASDGEILTCHQVSIYRNSTALSATARYLLAARSRAERASDVSGVSFLKLVSNSIAGRLAMRGGRWRRSPESDEPRRWGEGRTINPEKGTDVRLRYLAGICWEFDDDADGAGPHTAAFAYLAAYGRLMIRAIRDRLPTRTVVSQDTDGLWVLGTGTAVVAALGELVGPEPGQLRREGSAGNARFFGPRHYCVDGRWVLAGFSAPEVTGDGCTVWDIVHPSIWNARCHSAPSVTHVLMRRSRLKLDVCGGRVQPDGWVLPPHFLKSPSDKLILDGQRSGQSV